MRMDRYPDQDTLQPQGGFKMSQCDRCEHIIPDKDATTVISGPSESILGTLCPECVTAWFEFVEEFHES